VSGSLIVGMAGPREPIQLLFVDPSLDWSQTKTLTLTITQPGLAPVTNSSWAWTFPDAHSALATWVLAGTEITQQGAALLSVALTLNASVIGCRSWAEQIVPR